MALNYICYIRNGHLQVEDADAAGGPSSNATLFASEPKYPQKVHFQHPGKHPFNQQSKEALALAAHKAWITAKHTDELYQQGGIDVLHGRMRNVSYTRLQTLIGPEEEPEPSLLGLK
ncbi:hypothetical protein [Legionella sp. km772]|uniref:hypothetical protein n=1 Tax=Legionella sp. km772 TaxID=2498111 RepID=UPI000F8F15B3|nr:hypothetical protein [Legionella sp. km772]RUR07804.1 hypothetical protein ELY15_11820 [Legionella sp. km772]